MADLKGLKLKQISDAVKEGRPLPAEKIGQRIRDIREALGMTQKQLSKRLKISQPLLSRIEENAESCAVKTLVKIAGGLECEFMGVMVSKEGLEKIINKQAEIKARNMLKRTFATMAMEKQAPTDNAFDYQLKKLIEELANNPGPNLWEK
ncbi:helix-turn-helix domain-containing protein [Candidatus Saganbacteria bacterium]|nr:helix-turn-helix domain-containing protein [Candidatus Saganbacteria bacterium]